jgi:hypothetical protein
MNATVQCFRHMPDLREDLNKISTASAVVSADSDAVTFSTSFRDMLNALDRYLMCLFEDSPL